MQQSPEFVLQTIWKHQSFRSPQKEIIEYVLNKNDLIALLPTGAGKSLCYQIPALISEGICLVISPLIALMNDQFHSLEKKGIKAMVLSSQMTYKDTIRAFDNLKFGNYKLLYLSPEKLQSDIIQNKIKELQLSFIAIDEAHCISEWGHDFRPSYLRLSLLKDLFPSIPIIALTATATKEVVVDIENHLNLKNPKIFRESHFRENLSLNVIRTEDIRAELIDILNRLNEPGIVYVNSRKKTIDLSNFLNQNQLSASYFHGGLNNEEKKIAYHSWISEETRIMVATNAFGMGIDKSNVRVVVHADIPVSLENYLQESGRAGRDKKNAFSYLLYNHSSIQTFDQILQNGLISKNNCIEVYKNLMSHFQISPGEIPDKIFDFDLSEFCNKYNLQIQNTFNVLNFFENTGILTMYNSRENRSKIRITTSNEGLFRHYEQNPSSKELIQNLCRNYGGIFDLYTPIEEIELAKNLKCSKGKIISLLKQLDQQNILSYSEKKSTTSLKFLTPREDRFVINSIQPYLKQLSNQKIKKARAMIKYIEQDSLCRNLFLQEYLGESSLKHNCGKCDICENKTKRHDMNIVWEVEKLLSENTYLTGPEIIKRIESPKENIIKTLRFLLENGRIELNSQNRLTLNKNE